MPNAASMKVAEWLLRLPWGRLAGVIPFGDPNEYEEGIVLWQGTGKLNMSEAAAPVPACGFSSNERSQAAVWKQSGSMQPKAQNSPKHPHRRISRRCCS